MGVGATAVVALKHNRSFLGFELVEKYVEIVNARINRCREAMAEQWTFF